MPLISTAAAIILLLLLALQWRRSQVAAKPIRTPVTAVTAASHAGKLFEQSEVRGGGAEVVPVEVRGEVVLCVVEL